MTKGELLMILAGLPDDMTIDLAINVDGITWVHGRLIQVDIYNETQLRFYFKSNRGENNDNRRLADKIIRPTQ